MTEMKKGKRKKPRRAKKPTRAPTAAHRFAREKLPEFFAAIGRTGAGQSERTAISEAAEACSFSVWKDFHQPKSIATVAETIELLARHSKSLGQAQRDWESLEFIHEAIDWVVQHPESKEDILEPQTSGYYHARYAAQILEEPVFDFDQAIRRRRRAVDDVMADREFLSQLLRQRSSNSYRKDATTVLVIEPFYRLLKRHGIVWHAKLPRTKMLRAWYGVVGLHPDYRPAAGTVQRIFSNLEKAAGAGGNGLKATV